MATSVRITEVGNPEVITFNRADLPPPQSGEVRIVQNAIGVNILDLMQRQGVTKVPLPSGLGLEAAGIVSSIGPDVDQVSVGDRVGYILGPIGSYADERNYPAQRLVKLPDWLSFDDAAAIMFKGITAQYLLKTTHSVGPGTVAMLYGATGALGRIMVPWMRHLGAQVIGIVTERSGVSKAIELGCTHALAWEDGNTAKKLVELTNGQKADLVYDGIGKQTLDASLDSLACRGTLVSIGASSGAPDPIALATLNEKGSLYATRPGLAHHATNVAEYLERAQDVFAAVEAGIITPHVGSAFSLDDAANAHRALEKGGAGGAVILRP